MQTPPKPSNESSRLRTLRDLGVLDTETEQRFDRLTRLATRLFDLPIAAVSLVDQDRQWFKSIAGLDVCETGRKESFCGHTILTPSTMVVPDATRDARFVGNPLVLGDPNIRFYAGTPLTAPNGSRVGTLCVIDRAPREFSTPDVRLLEDLAQLVERELFFADIESARAAAESANATMSAFVANVSHELRNPLHAILGGLELIEQAPDRFADLELLESLTASSRSLLTLINDVLDLSKIQSGRFELDLRPFNLSEFVQSVRSVAVISANQRGLDVRRRVDDSLPTMVVGDEGRLRQVLINLTHNAIKFTPSGFVEIAIDGIGLGKDGRSRFRFAVRDTGVGMTEEQSARVFHAFQQAEATTSRDFGGTGLGLTIAQDLVGQMGGELTVRSEPGVGTTFDFTLELEVAGRESDSSAIDSAVEEVRDRPRRVLVVDDTEENLTILSTQLGVLGHEAVCCDSGHEALSKLRTESFDLILTDLQMPEMDGIEVARRVRGLDGNASDTPLVVVSASLGSDERRLCAEAGATDYVTKPIGLAGLSAAIEAHARRAASRSADPSGF